MTTISLFPDLPDPVEEWVYYGTDGYNIKIGTSADVERRDGELKVIILLKLPGAGFAEERRHHRMWAHYRIRGTEWFRPGDQLLLWITAHLEARSQELATLQMIIRRAKAPQEKAA